MTRSRRGPTKKTFSGRVYKRVGGAPTKSKGTIKKWAGFQRKVNQNRVRIVPVSGGYEGYMRRGSKK